MTSDQLNLLGPQPGCLVELLSGNAPQLAWVVESQADSLKVYTINKRETRLPVARLLPWSGPVCPSPASRQVMDETLAKHQATREELGRGIDPDNLWALVQGEVPQARIQWLAELLWTDPGPDHLAALGRTLLQCKSRFKFQPPFFEIYPAEKVELKEREQKAAKDKEDFLAGGRDFLQALWAKSRNHPGPAGMPAVSDGVTSGLKDLLLTRISRPEDQDCAKIFEQMTKGLPADPHLALVLAQTWGLLPAHANYLLLEADYAWGDDWADQYVNDIAALKQVFATASEDAPLDPGLFVSIDAASTRDMDDAFYLEKTPEGRYRLRLALACPALLWPFGAELDRAVFARASSLYLPEGDSHMLPEIFGADLFSLLADQKRPAMIMDMLLDQDGALLDMTPQTAWIKVTTNLHYQQAEEMLDLGLSGQTDPLAAMLANAFELAEKLRASRLERGAIIIERPEPEIALAGPSADPEVTLSWPEPANRAHSIINELMILANTAAAEWAGQRGLPMIYRVQDLSLPKEMRGVFSQPQDIFPVIKTLGNASLDSAPKRHASLAAEAYSPVSSPLRRYVDLLNQAQMVHFLTTGQPRLDSEQLDRTLTMLGARLEAVGRVQRFRPRYWKLIHLKQQPERVWDGVLVEEGPVWLLLALPEVQVFVRGKKNLFGEKLFPGQEFSLRLGKIDPLSGDIQIIEAWEKE